MSMVMIWGICFHDIDARTDSLQDKRKRTHAENSKGLIDADMKADTVVKRKDWLKMPTQG